MVHVRRWFALASVAAVAAFLAGCAERGPLTVPESEAPPGAARAGVAAPPTEGGAQPAAPQPGQAETAPPTAE